VRRENATVTVERPPQEVFDWIADYRNVPRVLDGVQRWQPVGGKRTGVGATYDVRLGVLGIGLGTRIKLTRWEPPRLRGVVAAAPARRRHGRHADARVRRPRRRSRWLPRRPRRGRAAGAGPEGARADEGRDRSVKVFLGHGASGGVETIEPYAEGLRRRGFDAAAVALPRGPAERALPRYLQQSGSGAGVVIGGHSFGARVASLLAADGTHEFGGLLLFSYPLHRPGFPDQLRTAHWDAIRCPVLLVSGTADPFATGDLLTREARKLERAEVVILPGAGHGFKGVNLDAALDAAATWLGSVRQ
jgi:predicted alpha/beta-hydrolase family hydrolase